MLEILKHAKSAGYIKRSSKLDLRWKKEVLEASKRISKDYEEKFLKLVDQANNKCDLETAEILLKTFTNTPDYGTQERVINVLSTAKDEVVIQAVLKELPRLAKEAPEWAESLIATELAKRPALLTKLAKNMDEEIRNVLLNLVHSKDFQEFYPEAKEFKI